MVSDESVVDQETSERLLDFSERPELKRLLDQFDVVKVEVSKNKKCMHIHCREDPAGAGPQKMIT